MRIYQTVIKSDEVDPDENTEIGVSTVSCKNVTHMTFKLDTLILYTVYYYDCAQVTRHDGNISLTQF